MELDKQKELAVVNSVMTILGYVISVILIVLGGPLVLDMIEPNSVYGVRTAEALSDENVWYHLNYIGGWGMIASGMLSCITIYRLNGNKNLNPVTTIIAISCVPALFPAVILIVLIGFIF